jgi:hypothetical protein
LCCCLGWKLRYRSDDYILPANRAVDLYFSPSEFPDFSFSAIRQFETAVLMTRAPHHFSFR